MNTVSFCITSYVHDVHLIDELLDSLSRQTVYPNEIVIYTSGVRTIDLHKDVIFKNKKIPITILLRSEITMQSVARNTCASIASGDIIVFFDVDDVPHPQKIEITKYVFDKYNPDFFVHNYSSKINDSNIDTKNISVIDKLSICPNSTNLFCEGFPIHHAHIAVRKKVFENTKFNEHINAYRKEDGIFCQDLVKNNYRGIYTLEQLVQYNQ